MVGFGDFINYGTSGMRGRPRYGTARQQGYGKRITRASYANTPTPKPRGVQWPSVSAGVPPTQARRQRGGWQPAPEESFPTLNAITRGVQRQVEKETGIRGLGDLFLRLVNKPEPVEPGEPTPDLHWSDPKSQFYKGVRSLNKQLGSPSGPTSKYLPPYERLKKHAKTHKISEDKFNQQWMDWHNNVPGALNPHEAYAEPAVAPIKSGRGLRASLVGGPAEKVESPYVRGKRHAKTHGIDEQTYDQQWMDWHNNVPGAIDPTVAYAEAKPKAPNKTPQAAGESSEATSTTPAPQAPRLNPDGTKPSAKEALVRNIKKDKKGSDNE